MKKIKQFFWNIAPVVAIAVIVFAAAYVGWWRCGEMYPHAQLACFIGGK